MTDVADVGVVKAVGQAGVGNGVGNDVTGAQYAAGERRRRSVLILVNPARQVQVSSSSTFTLFEADEGQGAGVGAGVGAIVSEHTPPDAPPQFTRWRGNVGPLPKFPLM